ncbi:MAG: hypothetical protein PHF46_04920, partial [Candidatus Gracilibacteria bacterium]|nr:hypothetical protein [Candidatus Gracilibacteria bacterium]
AKNNLVDYKLQMERIKKVVEILTTVRYGIYALIGFFFFAVFIIIYNTIWNFVFFYKDEIYITKLVGGDDIFVYGPFSLQGFLYAGLGYFLGLFAFLIIFSNINVTIINFSDFRDSFMVENRMYFYIEFFLIALVGLMSGFLSSKKFIKETYL